MYDKNNVFARIIRGELPCKKFYEDDQLLAFEDIQPVAPTHILVVPKGEYVSFHEFMEKAQEKEIVHFFSKVKEVASKAGLSEKGYRIVSNHKEEAGQAVYHFHLHIIGGKQLGGLIGENN